MRGSAGGFQQMTQDALTVLNDIPFSIPPYFALLGKDRPTHSLTHGCEELFGSRA